MADKELSTRAKNILRHLGPELATLTPRRLAEFPNCGAVTYYEIADYLGIEPPSFHEAITPKRERKRHEAQPLKPPGSSLYLTVAEMDSIATSNPDLADRIAKAKERAEIDYARRAALRERTKVRG